MVDFCCLLLSVLQVKPSLRNSHAPSDSWFDDTSGSGLKESLAKLDFPLNVMTDCPKLGANVR